MSLERQEKAQIRSCITREEAVYEGNCVTSIVVSDNVDSRTRDELLNAQYGTDELVQEVALIAIPRGQCIGPKQLLLAWLDSVDAVEGMPEAGAEEKEVAKFRRRPLFRQLSRGDRILAEPMSDRFGARLVQRCAFAAGYAGNDYAGHSLRSGFLTEAARQGATVFKMRDVSRHRSLQVLADYVQDAELFEDHAGEGFL